MPRQYGKDSNFKGKKGRSGDKPDSVKIAAAINSGLANEIGNEELKRIKFTPTKKRKRDDLKEIVMPVVLKGMTEKKEFGGTIKVENITGMEVIKDENPIQKQNSETNPSG